MQSVLTSIARSQQVILQCNLQPLRSLIWQKQNHVVSRRSLRRLNQKALIRVRISPLKGISGENKRATSDRSQPSKFVATIVDIANSTERIGTARPATMTFQFLRKARCIAQDFLIVRANAQNRPTTKYLLQRYYFGQAEEDAARRSCPFQARILPR